MSEDERGQSHRLDQDRLVELSTRTPIWDRFFTIAPLILIGAREPDGCDDVAPKHMACPMGWQNYFGFGCTPRHATYQNIACERAFAVLSTQRRCCSAVCQRNRKKPTSKPYLVVRLSHDKD